MIYQLNIRGCFIRNIVPALTEVKGEAYALA